MKTMKMFFLVCSVVIISLSIVLALNYFKNKSVSEELPNEFERYQSIDSSKAIISGNATMSLLLESTEEIQSFLTPDQQVIIYTIPKKNTHSFFKVSRSGSIIDSLTINGRQAEIVFIKGFILDKKNLQYYSWSFSGNKRPINIITQNGDFAWNKEQQQKQLAEIIRDSEFVYVDYQSGDSPAPQKESGEAMQTTQAMMTYAILTYFINGNCTQLYTTIDISEKFPWSYTENLLFNNLFKYIDTSSRRTKAYIKAKEIQYRYFQKLTYEKVHFSGSGGYNPGFDEMLYSGNLFTDISYKNDTLRLKEFMYLNDKWHQSAIEINGKNIGTLTKNKVQPPENIDAYGYYSHPKLEYALFTTSDKKIFIIK
ncbi:hypothetical protein U9K52_12105 [Chryseobacterium sp. MHB01]|uniref:hypothetical protein n=1 Tax=Chryseobacterium sp. MHB01 TaxID=3109433 RepID=UPI002AFFA7E7|nr:hypothetical protein [Chryseobacterium sp. MHB01]MEA1849658.1 hypothetical protein [Chryseobacterium sp. MHB01]